MDHRVEEGVVLSMRRGPSQEERTRMLAVIGAAAQLGLVLRFVPDIPERENAILALLELARVFRLTVVEQRDGAYRLELPHGW